MTSRLAVFGAGALGGLVAARLAAAGRPVNLIARGEHLRTIREHGLTVIDGDRRWTQPLNATDEPASLGEQDLVFICLKDYSLAGALPSLAPLIGPRTRIVAVMNGIPWWFLHRFGGDYADTRLETVDPGGRVSALLPAARTCGCVVHLSAAVDAPGVIRRVSGESMIVGAADPDAGDHAAEIANHLRAAGFDTTLSDRIRDQIWIKLWGNMTMNPISALTRSLTDRILDDPLTEQLVIRVMEEARAIGERLGIRLAMSAAERNARTRQLGAFSTSMLQDLRKGRPLEVEALLGAPHELARLTGVDAPFLATLYGLTRQLSDNASHQ